MPQSDESGALLRGGVLQRAKCQGLRAAG